MIEYKLLLDSSSFIFTLHSTCISSALVLCWRRHSRISSCNLLVTWLAEILSIRDRILESISFCVEGDIAESPIVRPVGDLACRRDHGVRWADQVVAIEKDSGNIRQVMIEILCWCTIAYWYVVWQFVEFQEIFARQIQLEIPQSQESNLFLCVENNLFNSCRLIKQGSAELWCLNRRNGDSGDVITQLSS